MDIVVFEHDQEYVLEAFRRGDFDFVDGVSEVAEVDSTLLFPGKSRIA